MSEEFDKSICKEAVFEKVYEAFAQGLHDYLYYKYGEEVNPKDLTQEAFIKLWDHCKKVSFNKAKSFLFTVANNIALNNIKHKKVVLKYQNTKPKDYTHENPEFLFEKEQFLQRYKKVLESLSEEQRTAFLLSKAEGKKHREIAEILGVTQKVVEYRIYSAFEILRNELDGFSL
ncbi:RNA polymerase sigma factor [Gaetbulibacter aestuarii]|uniref:Sigma-70 family RNA polymerase sigma factor n=1 Tax=Gaetbulibacter aestuarii TaxID=1502358 RepID=A0ABW7MWR7_9FLAO